MTAFRSAGVPRPEQGYSRRADRGSTTGYYDRQKQKSRCRCGHRRRLGLLAWDLRGVVVHPPRDLVAEPHQRVVLAANDPLLERYQRVVGDVDVLRANLGAALGDVAHAEAEVLLSDLAAVGGV